MLSLTDPKVFDRGLYPAMAFLGEHFIMGSSELETLKKEVFNAGYESGNETASLSIANARRQGRLEATS